jgi:hypothetical protein
MKITGITRGNAFVIWLLTPNSRHLSGAPGFHRRRQVRVVTQVENGCSYDDWSYYLHLGSPLEARPGKV